MTNNTPQLEIPERVSNEARQLIESFNREVRETFAEAAVSTSQRTLDRALALQARFEELKLELPQYGLEWTEWPDTIGDQD